MHRTIFRVCAFLAVFGLIAGETLALNFTQEQAILSHGAWRLSLISPGAFNGAMYLVGLETFTPLVLEKLDVKIGRASCRERV